MPTAPTSASFLRYGDIQNSEFTGTNSVKIPLHNIKTGNIEFPISLDYINGNGIRVDDEGSSVGIGWNLGLPAIVQTIYGIDDFDFEDEFVKQKIKILLHYQPTTPWGLLNYNYKYLESLNKDIPSGYVDQPQIGKYTYYYSSRRTVPIYGALSFVTLNNGTEQDATVDIFTLNLFGNKIQFFISNHQYLDESNVTPYFECLTKGYKVDFNKNLFSFTVTAPDGTSYIFGRTEKTRLYQTLNRNFLLTQIMDKNNNSIYFSYNEYSGNNFITEPKRLNYSRSTNHTRYPQCDGIPIADGNNNAYFSSSKARPVNTDGSAIDPFSSGPAGEYRQSRNIFQQSYSNFLLVSNITWDDGELIFSYSSRADKPTAKLDNIYLNNKAHQNVKIYNFNYEYVTADSNYGFSSTDLDITRMTKRLFLNKLTINNIDEYYFDYFNKEALPRKDSYAIDYWGYFNGGSNNKTYFINPKDFNGAIMNSLPITDLNNNKKIADINYVTAGLIKKIIYPTKGYSLFDYELNSASNLIENSSIQFGKGVRFKGQTNYDNNANIIDKTEFEYENGYSTNRLSFVQEISQTYPRSETPPSNGDWISYSIISMNSTNNYSSSILSSGDYVGYEKVTKKKVNGNLFNGKIISTFSINPDVFYSFWANQMMVNIPSTKALGIDNGKLLSQIVFDQNNFKLKEITNIYDTKYSQIFYSTIFSSISEWLYICGQIVNSGGDGGTIMPNIGRPNELHVVSHFPIFSKESLLSAQTTVEYINGKEATSSTSNTYNSYNLLTSKNSNLNSGDNVIENFGYTSSIPEFNYKNILSELAWHEVIKNGTKVSMQYYDYRSRTHLNRTSVTNVSLPSNIYTAVTFDRYDTKGNLLQYTTKETTPVAIIWGYNNTQPIAEVKGATYPDPSNPKPATDLSQSLIDSIIGASDTDAAQLPGNDESSFLDILNSFRKDPSNSNFLITTYTYDPLIGVRSITPPSGIREVYLYDNQRRLMEVRENDKTGKILKEYSYKYAPVKYFSSEKSQTFTRNNCGSNYAGGTYIYSVPANKYSSYTSQADADQQAQNDINANGQNAANMYGSCTYLVDCGFIAASIIPSSNVLTKSIKMQDNTVNFQLTFSPKDVVATWSSPTYIGYIPNPTCRPSGEKFATFTAGNQSWDITTRTNGDVVIKLTAGTVNPNTFIPPITINYSYTK